MPRAARLKPAALKTKKRAKPDENQRIARLISGLEDLYPKAHCELDYGSPFQLLVAVILSAQCTDKRVNLVTPSLFARFPDAAAMASADPAELESLIKSTGFYRNKTKSILGAARLLMEEFDGEVPRTMDELLTLPGVARKTANVILGTAFGMNEGFVVDTHIGRLAYRLRLSRETDPVKVERDLCKKLPREKWTQLGHQLIWHGRRVCFARSPNCAGCALVADCPSAGKV
ncbi:MAG TPA: endonuclease III [Polyangia bacterium]|nr:endonuclease III [Polyangia bacterium]